VVRVVAVGLGLVESVPFYHAYPGRLAARIALPPPRGVRVDCGGWEECAHLETVGAPEGVEVPVDIIAGLVARWRPALAVLDSPESWRGLGEFRGRLGVGLAVRSVGALEPGAGDLEGASALKAEYVSAYTGEPAMNVRLSRTVDRAVKAGLHVEVDAYVPEASMESVLPALEAAASHGLPLHVHVEDHGGGGPVRSLYEAIRRRHPLVYIHAGLYSYRDTYCPRCGTPLISRSRGYATSSALKNGSCPRCGAKIKLLGGPPKPDPRAALLWRRGVEWYDPRFLISQKRRAKPPRRGEEG